MIAVAREKYTGIKTFDGQRLLNGAKKVFERLSPEDQKFLEKMLSMSVEFMDNPMFHNQKSEEEIEKSFSETDQDLAASEARLLPIDLFEEGDKALTAFKPLSYEQENRLFLKLNYARYRIYLAVKSRENKPLTITMAPELLYWRRKEFQVRSQITQANIPLVLAMAKRTKLAGLDFTELISEGNMALLRCVDKFDCARGFKFSTYACRAILKSFSRVALKANRYRGRFPVEFDPDLERSDYLDQRREDTKIYCMDRLRDILDGQSDTADLSETEKSVLRARFAIRENTEEEKPMTLEQVGKVIGVTKERVRQIQNKALQKLKVALEDHVLNS
ncbi:MAG: sigma-70 family RNA polymerase sigma factor [Phycisphaerae bacterium]